MELLIIIIFLFCAALAAGSILLVLRLMEENRLPLLRSLFYYIIFIFAFGFYGVWGQFLISMVAGKELTQELLSSISVISLLLGLPFLVFAWLMLLQFSAEGSGVRFKSVFTALFLVLNFAAVITLGYLVRDKEYAEALPMIKYYYSASSVLFTLLSSLLLLKNREGAIIRRDRKILSVTIISGAIVQAAVLIFMDQALWMALVFVFLLFASNTLVIIYLSYKTEFVQDKTCESEQQVLQGVEDLFRKYDISPREAEIIREICNGLSNQEIADRLFISLQTVKDHTSRIYSKTNVRSRMQLMTLIRNSEAK